MISEKKHLLLKALAQDHPQVGETAAAVIVNGLTDEQCPEMIELLNDEKKYAGAVTEDMALRLYLYLTGAMKKEFYESLAEEES